MERDVQRTFPPSLVACIRDGRLPTTEEVSFMARKIMNDTLPAAFMTPYQALIGAHVALQGAEYGREQPAPIELGA